MKMLERTNSNLSSKSQTSSVHDANSDESLRSNQLGNSMNLSNNISNSNGSNNNGNTTVTSLKHLENQQENSGCVIM